MSEILMPSADLLSELTDCEMYVYRYILQNYNDACDMSVRQLAHAAHSSPASIIRLVRKFGYPGYPEFQQRLREDQGCGKIFFPNEREFGLNTFFDLTCHKRRYKRQLDRAAAVICASDVLLFAGDSFGVCACEAGIHLFAETGRTADWLIYYDPFTERDLRTCVILITGNCNEEESLKLYERIPVGYLPVIVIHCGGEKPKFPCDMIACQYDETATEKAASLIPAIHTLEELRIKVNSFS